jgi:chromosome partitioning protein
MNIIAIANQKGGVGKTTTAINFAAGLSMKGYRTLLVDLDMQANTTVSFFHKNEIKHSLYDVLVGTDKRMSMSDVILETDLEKLDLLAADIRIGKLDKFAGFEELYRLKYALDSLQDYAFCVLDCPPNLGNTLTQALLAANQVIIPIKADYYSMEGVADLLETIHYTKKGNPQLNLLGVLVTEFDQRETICGQAWQAVADRFGDLKFAIDIRKNTTLRSAPSLKKTIYEHDPNSFGANDYFNFTEEVLERLNIKTNLRVVEKKAN